MSVVRTFGGEIRDSFDAFLNEIVMQIIIRKVTSGEVHVWLISFIRMLANVKLHRVVYIVYIKSYVLHM